MTEAIAADRLRQYIEAIERLESDKEEICSEISDKFAEAKSEGFDVKTMRAVLKLRKMNPDDRLETETLLDMYKDALGIVP